MKMVDHLTNKCIISSFNFCAYCRTSVSCTIIITCKLRAPLIQCWYIVCLFCKASIILSQKSLMNSKC